MTEGERGEKERTYVCVCVCVRACEIVCVCVTVPEAGTKLLQTHIPSSHQILVPMVTGCDPAVDLAILVDASESMIVNDPFGQTLYNWNKVSACVEVTSSKNWSLPVRTGHFRQELVTSG